MKIAIVYNCESKSVINLFGVPNREKVGLKTIKRIADALKSGGHQVIAVEGDKDLIHRLEEFMPRVVKGERPGLVFNISYGVQGQARYTHVPGILEMVGIPYVGSGPLAHSLALDKVVAKMIFRAHGLPTPDFAVLETPEFEAPALRYPVIVKPRSEAVSFGLKVVHDEDELRQAAGVIFEKFQQPVLAEEYIEGKEVNVGLLGNQPPEPFPPVMLEFGEGGPNIYTYEDKTGRSGREIRHKVPAPISPEATSKVRDLAVRAFRALGCADCARVDFRMDADENFYILEINSLPSLGEHGSYLKGAEAVGLDFATLVNRLVEVASARYFGTPQPPALAKGRKDIPALLFSYLTSRRDRIEARLREWVRMHSRTGDPVGVKAALQHMGETFSELGMVQAEHFAEPPLAALWETPGGFRGGVLLVAHADVPLHPDAAVQPFRREPEWIHGEGVGSSRAPLVCIEFALRALRNVRLLRKASIGVFLYGDEGADAQGSARLLRQAAREAGEVLVLRPGNPDDKVITRRRGQRKYRLTVEGRPRRPGQVGSRGDVMSWLADRLARLREVGDPQRHLSVAVADIRTASFPMLLPHRAVLTLLVTYLDPAAADEAEEKVRVLLGREGTRWNLERISDRPPFRESKAGLGLYRSLLDSAERWEIPLRKESSVWPSVAGLTASEAPTLCGVGPVARALSTPDEAVFRLSVVQRALILANHLAGGKVRRP